MPEKILFRPKKMEVMDAVADIDTLFDDTAWSSAVQWGRTQGGVTYSQVTNVREIMSDQSDVPVYKKKTLSGSTLNVNLLEADLVNLQEIFGGENVAAAAGTHGGGFKVKSDLNQVSKAVRFTTEDVKTGDLVYVIFPNLEFTCETDLNLADSETVIAFDMDVMEDDNGYTWGVYVPEAI